MRITLVETVSANWNDLEDELQRLINDREAEGWEISQIAGPAFANGSHVILVFQKERAQ